MQISCGQINVTGGGSGTPGPKVQVLCVSVSHVTTETHTQQIPGVYTGNEPGILLNIYVRGPYYATIDAGG